MTVDKQHGRLVQPIEQAREDFNLLVDEMIMAYEFARRGSGGANEAILQAKNNAIRKKLAVVLAGLGTLTDATLDLCERGKQ